MKIFNPKVSTVSELYVGEDLVFTGSETECVSLGKRLKNCSDVHGTVRVVTVTTSTLLVVL